MGTHELSVQDIQDALSAVRDRLMPTVPAAASRPDAPELEYLTTAVGVFLATASPAAPTTISWSLYQGDPATSALLALGRGTVGVDHPALLILSTTSTYEKGGFLTPSMLERAVTDQVTKAIRAAPGWKALFDRATAFEVDRAAADLERTINELRARADVLRDWQIHRKLLTHEDENLTAVAAAIADAGFEGTATELFAAARAASTD